DENGIVLATNQAWREFKAGPNAGHHDRIAIGANYLVACDEAAGRHSAEAAAFSAGIRAVIRGQQDEFAQEYACHAPNDRRWFIGRVTHFPGDKPTRVV